MCFFHFQENIHQIANFCHKKNLLRIKGFAFFTPFHLEYLFEMKFVILMLGSNNQFYTILIHMNICIYVFNCVVLVLNTL